jgi:uncharacterized protein DUF5330
MVSKWWMRPADPLRRAKPVINQKFTPNQIPRMLTPISRHLNRNANNWVLMTTADQRLIAKSTATGSRDGGGREMFFLLRLAFWLGLVLVLLPRDKTPESEKLPQVGASEAVSAATAAVSDMSQFCKRQPAACEVGGQAAIVIGHRAQDGARKLYRIITDKRPPDRTGSIGTITKANESLADATPRDTLTANDLKAEWRGVP